MANSRSTAARKNRHQRASSPDRSSRLSRIWESVLDVALTAWVLRVPIAWGLFGFGLLWFAPQAQDLLINVADDFTDGNYWRVAGFVVVLILVWALPVHYVSRLLLENDAGFQARIALRNSRTIKCVQPILPGVLGMIPFVAMLFACGRAEWNLPELAPDLITQTTRQAIYFLAASILAGGAVFLAFILYRDRLVNSPVANRAERIAGPAARGLHWLNPFPRTSATFIGEEKYLGLLLLSLMFICFAFLPFLLPAQFAELMPLAFFVPFVIGGWLPLLAVLSALGRHLRAPLIFMLVLLSLLIPRIIGDGYDVRSIDGPEAAQAITLQEALATWREVNCPNRIEDCPRPIIIAGSGGASRAGFFLVSVVGALLDDTLRAPMMENASRSQGHGLLADDIRKRIFAFSTVSGSSVGAVMTTAAMAAVPRKDATKAAPRKGEETAAPRNVMPCRREQVKLWHWNRTIAGWRDCLEALMAHDYLTSVFAGFIFRDTVRFPGRNDRAALLEQSWENHFERLIPRNELPNVLACEGSLKCPFRTLRPTKDRWLPLLVLNGTSVETGQRIVTSLLEWPAKEKKDNEAVSAETCIDRGEQFSCPIFRNTYLFHWLSGSRKKANDIRLSTAAHNSARFPFVSPPGEIRNNGNLQDRIVDGGYYENFGVSSALELAAAIQAIHPELAPFVLVVSNDPDIPGVFDPNVAAGAGKQFGTDIVATVGTIVQARSAAGNLAVAGLERALRPGVTPECNTSSAHIRVRPLGPERQLTMSWWLSRPVQRYLNAQIGAGGACRYKPCLENAEAIRNLLAALNRAPACSGYKRGIEVLQEIQKEESDREIKTRELIQNMDMQPMREKQ